MRRGRLRGRLTAVSIALALAGCGPPAASAHEREGAPRRGAAPRSDGLVALAGLDRAHGLDAVGGLDLGAGLDSAEGLSSRSGLMTTEAGRRTVAQMIRCALPPGREIVKQDPHGARHRFVGELGMYPSWESGSCGVDCQEQITSCLLAHLNATPSSIPIWLDSANAAVGWGRSAAYPNQEGSFFGNVFVSPPRAYYCDGRGFTPGTVPARIGADRAGTPYTNAAPGGTCDAPAAATAPAAAPPAPCRPAGHPNRGDGYESCLGYRHVMTVWRT